VLGTSLYHPSAGIDSSRQSPRRLYAALQVNPEGTNSGTFSACFQTNATSDNPIAVQSILPDLTNFKVKSLCSAMLN